MIMFLVGQVKNIFFSEEKNRTYVTVFDLDTSCDLNLTMEGRSQLNKGDKLDHVLKCETGVYKGSNSIIVREVKPNQKGGEK